MTNTTYTVIGAAPVLGTKPGDSFTADLEPEHERRLIEGGHIAVGGTTKRPSKPTGSTTPRRGATKGGASKNG